LLYRLQYEGEIHVTIIATGFSQTFEDNLWGGKSSAVSSNSGDRARARAFAPAGRPPSAAAAASSSSSSSGERGSLRSAVGAGVGSRSARGDAIRQLAVQTQHAQQAAGAIAAAAVRSWNSGREATAVAEAQPAPAPAPAPPAKRWFWW
jgi:hypothetical protein